MARRPAGVSFVERHGLWTGDQARAAKAAVQAIKKHKLELVRFSFADQHGVLRGKTVLAEDAPGLMQAGVTMTTTLLAKDTAHKTAFPVFTPGGGFDMAEMQGAGDFVMVADPATFQVCLHVEQWGAEYRLVSLRYVFPKRQAGAVLDAADSSRCAGAAQDRRLRLPRRPGSRIPSVQAGEPAAHARGRHLAAAGARSEPAQPGLPVSHREPLRSDRRGAGADPPRHHRARHAAALGGSRARAQASANSPSARRRASTPPTP